MIELLAGIGVGGGGYEHPCGCKRFIGDPSRNPAPATPRGELDLG